MSAKPTPAAPAPAPKKNAHACRTQNQEMEVLVRARYPLLYVVSWEEGRVIDAVNKIGRRLGKKVYEWSCSGGLAPAGADPREMRAGKSSTKDPLVALKEVMEQIEPAIYVFKDFHAFLQRTNYQVIRALRDIANHLKASYKTLVLLAPSLALPPDLEKDCTVIDYRLPSRAELGELLDRVAEEIKGNAKLSIDLDATSREEVLRASQGLTLAEAENVYAKALVTHGKLGRGQIAELLDEKKQIIRKSGILDYLDPEVGLADVGGMKNLKDWLVRRKLAFSDQARAFGLPAPKGVLLLGVQGCGKSLCAKAVSAMWELPLLRLDVGRMFGSLVGSSEENMRRATGIAESVAPCVLWIDEIDKAFAGMTGNSTDSGTSQRVLGTFLTWLAEKKESVFVVATANNVQSLPPELLRKGRFDETFFVDLPDLAERRRIFAIHLKKRQRDPLDFDLDDLGRRAQGFSGAEIEEAVVSALYNAFYEKARALTTDDIAAALAETVPLSRTMEESVSALRDWSRTRARNANIEPEERDFVADGAARVGNLEV